MKRIQEFFQARPGYTKCGNERVATAAKCAVSTVVRFKKTDEYKSIKQTYMKAFAK